MMIGKKQTSNVSERAIWATSAAHWNISVWMSNARVGTEVINLNREDAIAFAEDMLKHLAPEKLVQPARVPLADLPLGAFVRSTVGVSKGRLAKVVGQVSYDVQRDIERGSDIPANERVRVVTLTGLRMDVYNERNRVIWEPVEVEVTPETWTVVE